MIRIQEGKINAALDPQPCVWRDDEITFFLLFIVLFCYLQELDFVHNGRIGEERLQVLGILEGPAPGLPLKEAEKVRYTSALTPLGRVVASFPLAPRHGSLHPPIL